MDKYIFTCDSETCIIGQNTNFVYVHLEEKVRDYMIESNILQWFKCPICSDQLRLIEAIGEGGVDLL